MARSDDPIAMATIAPKAPVTAQRPVRSDLDTAIPKPDMARAMAAPDMEHPNGTPGWNPRGMSVLQQHVAWFDQNNDGIVYPWESYTGLRAIGFGRLFSVVAAFLFNVTFSYPTLPGYVPSLMLPIHVANIHKGKHPSSSETYDKEGRYSPVSFENIFSKYAKTVPDKLSLKELWNMTEGHRVSLDFIGWIVTKLEWAALYMIAKDEEGYLSKEAMRGVFDASVFVLLAEKNASKEKKS